MSPVRMDNVLIVVEDLDGAVAFFTELGLRLEGRMDIEGQWVDRVLGIDDVRSEVAMMRTPDGRCGVELSTFHAPRAVGPSPKDVPVNSLGIGRIMFAVDDLDEMLGRLQSHGAEVVDEVVQYEDAYRLCFIRGPEGIVLGLAQQLD
jgi:catechol 2,3-dioxygenase-like lactoylglutathione lyase family enzyme